MCAIAQFVRSIDKIYGSIEKLLKLLTGTILSKFSIKLFIKLTSRVESNSVIIKFKGSRVASIL